ncbi:MFS general substrate transporter [Corynespora cassiicola Philippines]|uniref:MFS general substrate transporter n=1 Tax=Corynespora cassiicola Philippines TaxID=1448308 RepID=A0A2T2NY67_CORCC|nr:MFS general substrate transporter [Corynespora cassiicola Philippines]
MATTTATTTLEYPSSTKNPIQVDTYSNPSPESSRPVSQIFQNTANNPSAPNSSLALPLTHPDPQPRPSNLATALTILQPSLINFFSSFTNGIITVGLPVIASSISLPRSLYLWPSSVYGLTSGAVLLLAGSVADITGPRGVECVGIILLGVFMLACGFAATGVQLVVFRALQGIAMAMHLPASVAIIAAVAPSGRARNVGFACLGLSQPLGFSVGLVVSGVLVERVGWRSGFWISGGATVGLAIIAVWTLPKVEKEKVALREVVKRIGVEIDWVGGIIASGGLALLAYVLAILSANLSTIRTPTTATLLALSVVLLVAFPVWMHFREKQGKPALVPNSLWKNLPFASTCIMVALSYGVMNSMELFSSLFFQEIQHHSTFTTSLFLLPNLIVGVILNLTVGLFVHRVRALWLVSVSAILCALAPLFMAIVNPGWSYWYMTFWAQVFTPFSGDVLFTVGLIIVSDNFPEKMQALAGAVFNTVAQFGMSLGIGSCQVIALGVMGSDGGVGHGDELRGYRAGFWAMFGYMVLCAGIAVVGLRRAGKVGLEKKEA